MTTPTDPADLCECGCGKLAPITRRAIKKRGYRKGERMRFINGHNTRRDQAAQFAAKVTIDPDTGCHLWTGAIDSAGYGNFHTGMAGGTRKAHRFAYERRFGKLEGSTHLHHTCRNSRCVNPGHLLPMSPAEHKKAHAAEDAIIEGILSGQLLEETRAMDWSDPGDWWPETRVGAALPDEVAAPPSPGPAQGAAEVAT
jgi:hypothetical protein